jgi:hypothetical protein
MSGYNLYQTLHLDRSRPPQQLAAELSARLADAAPGSPEYHELRTAQAILGDATRRTMYDRRLDDPTADVTVPELQQLATMQLPRGAGAAGAAGAGMTGPKNGAAGALRSVQDGIRRHPKASIATGAVAAVVVVGLAAFAVFGGGGGAKSVDDLDPDGPNYLAQREYLGYDFADIGSDVSVDRNNDGTADYTLRIENPQVLNTGSYPERIMCYESVRVISDDIIQRIKTASDYGYERSEVGNSGSSTRSSSEEQRNQEYTALDQKYGLPAGTASGSTYGSVPELENALDISSSDSYSQLAVDDPRTSTSGTVDENLQKAFQDLTYEKFRGRAVMDGNYLSDALASDSVDTPAALKNELNQKKASDPVGTVRRMTCVNAEPATATSGDGTAADVTGYAVVPGKNGIQVIDRDIATFGGWKFDN